MIRGAGRIMAWMPLAAVLWWSASAPASQPAAEPAAPPAHASGAPIYIPDVSQFLPPATNRESLSTSLQLLILFSVLTILPSIILMMTCFSRMIIVLVLLRQALGTASLPPSQVLIGLAFFLTLLVMAPTWERIHAQAVEPYVNGDLSQTAALTAATGELRGFMFDQIEAARNEQDVYMLVEYARRESIPETEVLTRDEVPLTALIPAFILSELKVAFVLGFRIYLPFLVIDMVISTILVSMGMLMLPPALISLPFKLLLFVLADGWHLVAGSLTASVAM
ncbi:MAG: Flagellar biosynthetic protein FliP [Phycisphaerae bacterium]|nr:Flagellar biosynthetic protein FliP [Phycisphaerae bacterium]